MEGWNNKKPKAKLPAPLPEKSLSAKQKALKWLDDIRSAVRVGPERGGIELSDWEEDFIASLAVQLKCDKPLSTKQFEKLEQIWDRV